jgi:amino acid exporter, AAE family (TC 2.A.3.13)
MEYQRSLGPIQGIAMTVTTFVGAGLMFLPALSVTKAGDFAMYAWIATVILALPIAFVFASLGSHFPSAGGASHYIGQHFGPVAEKSVGWIFLSILLVGPAVAIKIAAAYLLVSLGLSESYLLHFSLLTLLLLCCYGLLGVSSSSKIQIMIVAVLTLCVVALALKGNVKGSVGNLTLPQTTSEIDTTLLSIGTVFWCFLGIEVMAHMGAEFKNQNETFPLHYLEESRLSSCCI